MMPKHIFHVLTQCYANVKELLSFSIECFWQFVKMRRDNRKRLGSA